MLLNEATVALHCEGSPFKKNTTLSDKGAFRGQCKLCSRLVQIPWISLWVQMFTFRKCARTHTGTDFSVGWVGVRKPNPVSVLLSMRWLAEFGWHGSLGGQREGSRGRGQGRASHRPWEGSGARIQHFGLIPVLGSLAPLQAAETCAIHFSSTGLSGFIWATAVLPRVSFPG